MRKCPTLATQGQVVSTICTPRSCSRRISDTLAPKAGSTTTSSCFTWLKSLPVPLSSMISRSISFSRCTPADHSPHGSRISVELPTLSIRLYLDRKLALIITSNW